MARAGTATVLGSRKTSSIKLEWHGEEIKKELRAAQMRGISSGVDRVRDAAKARCPVKEGILRDSIKARMSTKGKVEGYVIAGGKEAPHAHLIELGTVTIPPNPFMRNAFDMNVGRVKKDMQEKVKEVVK